MSELTSPESGVKRPRSPQYSHSSRVPSAQHRSLAVGAESDEDDVGGVAPAARVSALASFAHGAPAAASDSEGSSVGPRKLLGARKKLAKAAAAASSGAGGWETARGASRPSIPARGASARNVASNPRRRARDSNSDEEDDGFIAESDDEAGGGDSSTGDEDKESAGDDETPVKSKKKKLARGKSKGGKKPLVKAKKKAQPQRQSRTRDDASDGGGYEDDDDDGGEDFSASESDEDAVVKIEDSSEAAPMAAGSMALKHLPKEDRARFSRLWTQASNVRSSMKAAISTGEDAGRSGGELSAAAGPAPSRDAIVTAAKLESIMGWSVRGAAEIAATGSAGTSARAKAGDSKSQLSLTPFQLVGLNWMLLLRRERLHGVLADEMGLGKSIQTAALLAYLATTGENTGPHLIVTPASTIANWVRELKKWAPALRTHAYRTAQGFDRGALQHALITGDGLQTTEEETDAPIEIGENSDAADVAEDREDGDDGDAESGDDGVEDSDGDGASPEEEGSEDDYAHFVPFKQRAFDVLVVAYNVFDRSGGPAAVDRGFLKRFKWEYLIADEGHALKNSASARFQNLIRIRAERRMLLSGTPIQNSLPELFSLLRFLQPDLFSRHIEKVFTRFEKGTGSMKARDAILEDVRAVLAPFILRRSKVDVLKDLPTKTETPLLLDLPAVHSAAYSRVLAAIRSEAGVAAPEPAIGGDDVIIVDEGRPVRTLKTSQSISSYFKGQNDAAATSASCTVNPSEVESSIAPEVITIDETHDEAPIEVAAASAIDVAQETDSLGEIFEFDVERAAAAAVSGGLVASDLALAIAPAASGAAGTAKAAQARGRKKGSAGPISAAAVVKKLKGKAVSIFGELRSAANHPLMIRSWYSHEPTLRRIAAALFKEGAFGFEASCNLERVYKELVDMSDLRIWEMCADYGYNNGLADATTATSASGAGSSLALDADARPPILVRPPPESITSIEPINLSAVVASGRSLLRAAATALPGWAWASSAKIAALGSFLPKLLAEGHKVLIFSQLMAVLTVLQVACASWGIRTVRLDGSTPVDDRQAMLDNFSNDPKLNVFLLSTKAGGLGLNLTAADTVIIHDVRLNPRTFIILSFRKGPYAPPPRRPSSLRPILIPTPMRKLSTERTVSVKRDPWLCIDSLDAAPLTS